MTADGDRAREEIEDVLTGWPIGSGYYATSVLSDDAQEMAEALLPTVRALMAEAAAAALEEAADRPDLKSAMGRDAVGCQTLRDRARALTAAHTEELT